MIWSGALTLCVRWRKCVDNGCVSSINAVYRRLRVLPWQQSMFGAAHKISVSQWKIYSDCANRRREQREHTHRSYIATVTQINTVTDSDLDVWVFTACNVTTLFSTEYLFGHFTAGVGKKTFSISKNFDWNMFAKLKKLVLKVCFSSEWKKLNCVSIFSSCWNAICHTDFDGLAIVWCDWFCRNRFEFAKFV